MNRAAVTDADWYRQAVIHRLDPCTLAEGHAGGTVDPAGIASRVDHLVALGMDAVWLSPLHLEAPTPGEDLDRLVDTLHTNGIRVVVDVEAPEAEARQARFREALAPGRGSFGPPVEQTFNGDLVEAPFEADVWRRMISDTLDQAGQSGSSAAWALSSHGPERPGTRPSPDDDPARDLLRARAKTALLLALPGSAHVYQGEELGLGEADDPAPGSCSALAFHVEAVNLRHELQGNEELVFKESAPGVIHVARPGGWECLTNVSEPAVELPEAQVVLASGPLDGNRLPPETTVWLRVAPKF
ncbi:hypothetical protein ACSDQ9_13920 [Aestuariimicrobium soli]|uniref:hypothetical protein n=1 Tax=Aestuariimicrobium soli TaxID=2035834 RepID=UPI003EC0589F